MSPSLSVVADSDLKTDLKTTKTETVAERVRRLQAEAKQLARDHIRALQAKLVEVQEMAAEIAEGGEAYPAGIRDIAARLTEDVDTKINSVEAILVKGDK